MTATTFETGRPDTPRSAYSVLQRRATIATGTGLLGLAALGWWETTRQASGMDGMVQGIAQVGTAMSFDMTVPLFLGMWTSMMVAMMFPTVAPIVLLHRLVIRRRGGGAMPTVAFITGYLVVWVTVGFLPLGALLAFRHVSDATSWVPRLGGAVLIVAGAYQFTRWKATCLRACQTPLTFLATHDFGDGLFGTLRVGISHGAYCLGCCWALMTVLFVVGLMNLAWMAVIAVIFLTEKNWRYAPTLVKVVGTSLIAFGLAVVIHPGLLSSVTSSGAGSNNDMMMMSLSRFSLG
jgi:predicted metal-binding membrane protein